jgi:predicted amidohydrolase
MKVALFQVSSPDAETQEERLARVKTRLLAIEPVDLIVLPELWSAGYFDFDNYTENAELLTGPTISMAQEIASTRGCMVHAGSIIERRPNGKLRNTAVLIDTNGEIVHTYSKVHVFGYKSLEAELLEPGDSLSVVETKIGPIAGTTCYDLRFPALWTELVALGAEIVIVPAAWPSARKEHWRLLTTARAVDNQVFVLACNATGTHSGVEAGGTSRVIDPWGRVVGEAGTAEEILIVDIDTDAVRRTRTEFPVLADRLTNYSKLSSPKGNDMIAPTPSTLTFESITDGSVIHMAGHYRSIVAGYCGRDEAAVQHHIEELAAIGVAPPPEVPMFYPMPTGLITTAADHSVSGDNSSGEVEPIIIRHNGEYFLGVGSDHTDRTLETVDIGESKRACPKPVAVTVVPIEDFSTFDWDACQMRCWVDGTLYQEGTLKGLREPADLLGLLDIRTDVGNSDFVCFAGTLPLIDGVFTPGEKWRIQLELPGGKILEHNYTIRESIPEFAQAPLSLH